MRCSSRSQLILGPAPSASASHWRVRLLGVTEDLEADELVDVLGRQRGLIELHAELLHSNRRDVDHGSLGSW